VHIPADSWPIEPRWAGEPSGICPRTVEFSPRPPKPDRLLTQQGVQAAAGERAEAQLLAQGIELVGLPMLALEHLRATGTGCIQRDPRQPPAHALLPRMLAQLRRATGGAAQAQESHFVDALEQCIQAAEVGEQGRGGLRANAGYAGDVVDRVAAQGEVVGNLVRMHAKLLIDAGRAPAQVAGV